MTARPDAQQFVRAVLHEALARTTSLGPIQERLRTSCAVRLRDMIDHIAVPLGERMHEAAGWKPESAGVWSHPSCFIPRVVERPELGVAFRVESVERLLQVLRLDAPILGPARGPIRRTRLFTGNGLTLEAVERNGSNGFEVPLLGAPRLRRAAIHQQIFRTRRRHFKSVDGGFSHTERLVDAAVADLGPLWACSLFLRAEREHWLSRCETGVLQKRRQDRAGVGWCTLDHIVYCSSREHFHRAAAVFRKLGYAPTRLLREGYENACAVQIFEHSSGLQPAVLIDIDLADETALPAAPLQPLTWRGRAGLWCAMHGESLLEGGPCRVAARYDLDALNDLVSRDGAELVAAFADGPHLRQRIAPGQLQAVSPTRIDALVRAGYLARGDAETLRLNGAIAAHIQAVDRAEAGFAAPDYADDVFGGPEGYRTPPAVPALPPNSRRTPVRLKRPRSMRQ